MVSYNENVSFKTSETSENPNSFETESETITISENINELSENNVPQKPNLATQLKEIFLEHQVGRKLGDDLLKVLNENGIDVQTTSKKLIKRKHTPLVVRTVNPGNYYHFGLKNQLINYGQF